MIYDRIWLQHSIDYRYLIIANSSFCTCAPLMNRSSVQFFQWWGFTCLKRGLQIDRLAQTHIARKKYKKYVLTHLKFITGYIIGHQWNTVTLHHWKGWYFCCWIQMWRQSIKWFAKKAQQYCQSQPREPIRFKFTFNFLGNRPNHFNP